MNFKFFAHLKQNLADLGIFRIIFRPFIHLEFLMVLFFSYSTFISTKNLAHDR